MASVEISSQSELRNVISSPVDIQRFIEQATEQLLFKDFEKCTETCEAGISQAKLSTNSKEDTEKLCVIAIQALAELNSWQQVLPFVQNVYGSIENCPQTVIQLCLLLHSRVKDFSQCQALCSVWLRNSNNFSNPEYRDLIQVYIEHVMVPQKQGVLIPAFIETCQGLSSDHKRDLIADYAYIMKNELKESKPENRINETKTSHDKTIDENDTDFFSFVRTLGSALFRKLPPTSLQIVSKVAVVLVFLYVIGLKSYTGLKLTVRKGYKV